LGECSFFVSVHASGYLFYKNEIFMNSQPPKSTTLPGAISHPAIAESTVIPAKKFEGKIVSMRGNKLVMSNKAGKNHSHTLAKDAILTCDGKSCKAEDLKAGCKVRVTTKDDDRTVATLIESLDRHAEYSIVTPK
jgi:hypothetical protein